MAKKKNPLVFLDVCIDGDPLERMVFELFSDVAPRTAENFRALCTGEKGFGPRLGKPLHYKGTFFHYILKGSMAQGGDLLRQEGSSGESIYGDKFPDEPPKLKHDESGLLSMSVADRSTRGSIFNLLFKANQNLDRKHVVFGKLVLGFEVLKKIESVGNEDGVPDVTVKIVNCGEFTENDKKRLGKKLGKQASLDAIGQETRRKVKHKKASRDKRKKRRRYYLSDSESSSDGELSSTESDSETESESESESETDTSSSDVSSSSDDRRKKRKRSRQDKHGRGKRRDRHRAKKRKRHGKRSRRKSKRALDSSSEVDSGSGSESSSGDKTKAKDLNQKHDLQITAENHILPQENLETIKNHKTNVSSERFDENRFPKENGEHRVNGCERDARSRGEDRQPDVVEDHPDKSRSRSPSPKRSMSKSKSMSISPRNRSINRSVSRSPSANKSPRAVPTGRSLSRSPMRSISKSPARSLSRSPSRSLSRSPPRSHDPRKVGVSLIRPQLRRSPSGSFGRATRKNSPSPVRSSRRSISPVRSSHRSISRSSGRAPSRRVASRSPVRSPRRVVSRSPVRSPRRVASRSPVRSPRRSYRRSPSRSPPPTRRRSLSRSASPDGSPKRVRRGRGFSDRYSFARKYRTPTPDRYRYVGRDRYSGYRRSPRRYRSPRRSPPRYRSRRSRSRSRSVSRSPPYRRRRYSRSRSPVDPPRYRASPLAEKRLSSSSRSRSPSASASGSSRGSSPLKKASLRSRSSSVSSGGKKGLVSYGDGSPESSPR